MEKHHEAWLAAHPERDEKWLSERLKDGFDVHHVDGDHDNNAVDNLVLIEHRDHMRLHGMNGAGRLGPVRGKKRQLAQILALLGTSEPLTTREISERTGIPAPSVHTVVYKHANRFRRHVNPERPWSSGRRGRAGRITWSLSSPVC